MDKGKIILHYRKLRNISQEELAAKVGTYRTTIGKYELGERKKIPTITLARIIAALDIPIKEILTEEELTLFSLIDQVNGAQKLEAKKGHKLFSGYSGIDPRIFAGDKYLVIEKAKYSPEQLSLLESIIATMDKQNAQ